jgi:hypothetical protein
VPASARGRESPNSHDAESKVGNGVAVTFILDLIEIRIDDDGLRPLVEELTAFSSTPLASGANDLWFRLNRGDEVAVRAIPSSEFEALLRALDHVRNAGALSKGGQRVRDAIVGPPMVYRLIPIDGRSPVAFMSYSGEYGPDDRLVAVGGAAYQVLDLERGADGPPLLTVDTWPDAKLVLS